MLASTCSAPDREVRLTRQAPVYFPDSARVLGVGSETVLVHVNVKGDGSVASVAIIQSSGNGSIDRAALQIAKASSYSPKRRGCVSVPGSFLSKLYFDAGPTPPGRVHIKKSDIVPPPEWTRTSMGQYVRIDGSTISVEDTAPYMGSLDAYHAQLVENGRNIDFVFSADTRVRICHGRVDAWMLSYSVAAPGYPKRFATHVFTIEDRVVYSAIFSSTTTQAEPDVVDALLTLCLA